VTRSKELRRIERAIENRDEQELKWALADCEVRKSYGAQGSRLYRLEKRIRAALDDARRGKP
jgi:hypothetical protein